VLSNALMCQGDGVNTYYVVVGADPGPKLAKAEKLGIKTLSEAKSLELLDKAGGKL
jgi:NAD-dependent DNA ligase